MEDLELAELRSRMVAEQLVARGIRDARVLQAMGSIPRHMFLPFSNIRHAYDDGAQAIGEGQTISQPYMVAIMTELLELKGTERVLEIGTGSGYQCAVLASMAKEVYSIERMAQLSERSLGILHILGHKNVHIMTGDGTLGWPSAAPFDRILITAAAPALPLPLIEQLAEGGMIVAPVGELYHQQLVKAVKHGDKLTETNHTLCVFVPLIGKHGWKE